MEILYKDLKFKTHTLKELLDFYDTRWRKEWHEAIIITKKDRTQEDYYNLGKKCIEDYYKRYYPFNTSKVLGLERAINIQLDKEGKYKITGYADRIAKMNRVPMKFMIIRLQAFFPTKNILMRIDSLPFIR